MTDTALDEQIAAPPGLVANARWNLLAFASALGSNFIVVPFVVRWIGLEAFGRAGLVIAVCAPLLLIGTVLMQAVVREMSSRLGAGDLEGARRVLDAALRLCILAGALGWLLLVIAGPWITDLLTGAKSLRELHPAFVIAATGWFAQQLGLVLMGASAARQNFRAVAAVAAVSAAATVATTLTLTFLLGSVEGYLAGVATGLLLTLVAWLWASRRDVRAGQILAADRSSESRALLRFAKWQSVAHIAAAVANQIDRYTLGALVPVIVIGQYNVAARIQEGAYVGALRGGEVLFPRFGSLSRNTVEQRGEFFQTASWAVGTFSAMVLAPIIPLSDAILRFWIGSETGEWAALLLRTLVYGGVVGCATNVFTYYAMGIGRNAQVAFVSVLYSVVTVISTIVLIHTLGPVGAGGGLLVASIVRLAAALAVTRRVFFPHLSWSGLTVSTVLPAGMGVLLAVVAQRLAYGEAQDVVQLVVRYVALAVVILAGTITASALTPDGREILSRAYVALRNQIAA